MIANKGSNIETLEKDVVVIGGGAAGLAAAVAAGERKADVLLIEKRIVPGGNAAIAEGFFAAESQAHKRMLIDASRVLATESGTRDTRDRSNWSI
jgi:fumarate reductase flavoprotein subunit